MKIKDFDEMKIGDKVVFEGRMRVIDDIKRNDHCALLGKGWVRCSEFEKYNGVLPEYETRKHKPYDDYVIVCRDSDGNEKIYSSTRECARHLDMHYTLVNYYIRNKKKSKRKGLYFERRKIA